MHISHAIEHTGIKPTQPMALSKPTASRFGKLFQYILTNKQCSAWDWVRQATLTGMQEAMDDISNTY